MYVNIAVYIYFSVISPLKYYSWAYGVCLWEMYTLGKKLYALHTGRLSVHYLNIELHVNVSVAG